MSSKRWMRVAALVQRQSNCSVKPQIWPGSCRAPPIYHLLTEIREKESVFLLDAPISQTGLFVKAISSLVDIFWSAKSQSAALRQFMPRRMRDHSNNPPPCLESDPCPGRRPPEGAAPRLIPLRLGSPWPSIAPLVTPLSTPQFEFLLGTYQSSLRV